MRKRSVGHTSTCGVGSNWLGRSLRLQNYSGMVLALRTLFLHS